MAVGLERRDLRWGTMWRWIDFMGAMREGVLFHECLSGIYYVPPVINTSCSKMSKILLLFPRNLQTWKITLNSIWKGQWYRYVQGEWDQGQIREESQRGSLRTNRHYSRRKLEEGTQALVAHWNHLGSFCEFLNVPPTPRHSYLMGLVWPGRGDF